MSLERLSATSVRRLDYVNQGTQDHVLPITYSEIALSLTDIVKDHSLPRVIKCGQVTCSDLDYLSSKVDLSQPLLAYKKLSFRKVTAHSLVYDSNFRDFCTIGNGMLIPENYPGWFAVLGAAFGRTTIDLVVPHFKKLSKLATSGCNHFLLAGKRSLPGVMIERNQRGQPHMIACQVLPGTVLTKAGLYREQLPKTKGGKKNKIANMHRREFLKCFDEQDREILINTQQNGMFYIVSQEGAQVSPPVLQMRSILQRFRFPLIVQLIHGRVPTESSDFTETFLLSDSGLSHTLVASTMTRVANLTFEIPLGTDMKFYVADHWHDLVNCQMYASTLQACMDKTPTLMRNIKVVYGSPRPEDGGVEGLDKEDNTSSDTSETASNRHHGKGKRAGVLPDPCLTQPPTDKSQMYNFTNMSRCMTAIDDNEDARDQSSSPTTSLGKSSGVREDLNIAVSSELTEVTTFNKPDPEILMINKGPGRLSGEINALGRWDHGTGTTSRHVYDNATFARPDSSVIEPNPPNVHTDSSVLDDSNIYWNSWDDELQQESATTSPHHLNSGLSPVLPEEHVYHILANATVKSIPVTKPRPQILPKPCTQRGRSNNPSEQQPLAVLPLSEQPLAVLPLSEQPRSVKSDLPQARDLREKLVTTSVVNCDSQFKDAWSQTSWDSDTSNQYEDIDVVNLQRVEITSKEDGLEALQAAYCNRAAKHVHNTHLCSGAESTASQLSNHLSQSEESVMNLDESGVYVIPDDMDEINEYITPIHVEYTKVWNDSTSTDQEYARPDSGVVEDYPGHCTNISPFSKNTLSYRPKHTRKPKRQCSEPANIGRSKGAVIAHMPQLLNWSSFQCNMPAKINPIRESNTGPPPPLPRRPKLAPSGEKGLGMSVPLKPTFTAAKKDMLIDELVKAGITKTTELGLRSLQLADFVSLLSKEDSFDKELITLLPKVGAFDLRKIAMCFQHGISDRNV